MVENDKDRQGGQQGPDHQAAGLVNQGKESDFDFSDNKEPRV